MSSLNTQRIVKTDTFLTDFDELSRSVMSTLLWEDNFYEDGLNVNKRIQDKISICYKNGDFIKIIDLIKKVKFDMRLRHTPLFTIRELVRLDLKTHEKIVLKELLTDCITRADDISEFLLMYFTDNDFNTKKQPIAVFIKKSLQNAFLKFDEYSLAKYSGYKNKMSLKDVMLLVRPKPKNEEQSRLFKKLIERQLQTPDTWEVELSKSKDKKVSWKRLLDEDKLGGLAMLRNIRNIKEAGVDALDICKGIEKINAGKLLPINFITSAIINPEFAKQLEDQFFNCFNKDNKLKGKTLVLLDVSGSMDEKISNFSMNARRDIAGCLGIILNEVCEYCSLIAFENVLHQLQNARGLSLIHELKKYNGGTELYGAIAYFKDNKDFDRVIVITDEQDTGGGRQSNFIFDKNKQYYIINVAPYKKGIEYRIDELSNVIRINGWSDKIVDYILDLEH